MQMDANYQFRGHVLQDFPWYFYVAAVDRVHLPHTDAYAFDADHPQVSSHGQVLLRNPCLTHRAGFFLGCGMAVARRWNKWRQMAARQNSF
eukprot:s846_g31.t1